jgi:predicted adenylyl cyclase CyaB
MQGIQVIIEKKREIYLYDNIRIHLDNVKKLGNFIEFEAVMDDKYNNKNAEIAKIKNLLAKLEIKEENLIKGSYENLIELLDDDSLL